MHQIKFEVHHINSFQSWMQKQTKMHRKFAHYHHHHDHSVLFINMHSLHARFSMILWDEWLPYEIRNTFIKCHCSVCVTTKQRNENTRKKSRIVLNSWPCFITIVWQKIESFNLKESHPSFIHFVHFSFVFRIALNI